MQNRIGKINCYGGMNYYIYFFKPSFIYYGLKHSGDDLKIQYAKYIKKLYEEQDHLSKI